MRMRGITVVYATTEITIIAIRGKDELPLGKGKVLSVVYCLAIVCHFKLVSKYSSIVSSQNLWLLLSNIVSILAMCLWVSLL